MFKFSLFLLGSIIIFSLGFLAARLQELDAFYVIGSINYVKPKELGPYFKEVSPMVKNIGLKLLGGGNKSPKVHVFEGKWPYEGVLVVKRISSLEDFENFWDSAEYQEIKKLREGMIDVNFIVGVEGTLKKELYGKYRKLTAFMRD